MYLSHLLINVGENPDRPRPGRLWLRNIYHVHQRLCMAFPSASRQSDDMDFLKPFKPEDFGPGQVHVRRGRDAGFLFRVNPQPGGRVVILVQSATKPDWDFAFHNASYLLAAAVEVRTFDPCFTTEQRLRFRLVANPTARRIVDETTRDEDGRPKRKRVGLFGEEQQIGWLRGKGEKGGFRLVEGRISAQQNHQSTKPGIGDKIKHVGVLFDGLLEVTDPQAFLETLENGIGSAKAFGFGLLSLARG